jgi:cytochrome P450
MSYDAASLYLKDTTGTKAIPAPGAEAEDRHRVHRLFHESDRQGLAGRGLAPTLEAYVTSLDALISDRATEDWTDVDDFWAFVQNTVGVAELNAFFGPKLLELYPEMISDFFEFDRHVPWLLKGMPHAQGRKARSRVLDGFGRWIKYARHQSSIHKRRSGRSGGSGGSEARTPWWGAEWTRYRHESFTSFFDDDAMAAHNLGVAWGGLGNTAPATLMALLHVVQDKELQERVRRRVDDIAGSTPLTEIPSRHLTSDALLSGIFAETLRLYVTVFVPVINMHGDLDLGRWRIPQGSYGLMNAGIAQRNEDVWNTRQGAHPVDSFWADRFIVDPADPESGPVRPEARQKYGAASSAGAEADVPDKPYFSTEGLDGSWIPFGGGKNMCPGRFMAKGIMAFTMALLATKLDIELKVDSVRLGTDRFGMGVELPQHKIPFRMRKRRAEATL